MSDFEFELEDKLKNIFEAVEDEENIDQLAYSRDVDDIEGSDSEEAAAKANLARQSSGVRTDDEYSDVDDDKSSLYDDDDDDIDYSDSVWGIENPKKGFTYDDLKADKVMGPARVGSDGGPADPTLGMDEEGNFVNRSGVGGYRGGKVTQAVYDKFPDDVKAKYVPIDRFGNRMSPEDMDKTVSVPKWKTVPVKMQTGDPSGKKQNVYEPADPRWVKELARMKEAGFDISEFMDIEEPEYATLDQIKQAKEMFGTYIKAKNQKESEAKAAEASARNLDDQIDDLHDKMTDAGKGDIADELYNQSIDKEDGRNWLISQYQQALSESKINEAAKKVMRTREPVLDPDGGQAYEDVPLFDQYVQTREDIDREYMVPENASSEDIASGNVKKWYFDDIVKALKYQAISAARKHVTPTYDQNAGFADAISSIREAWMTDLGRSPFYLYAIQKMYAAVKDGANESRHVSGEKKSKGGVRQWASAYKSGVSIDAPLGNSDEGSATIGSSLEGDPIGAAEKERRLEIEGELERSTAEKSKDFLYNVIGKTNPETKKFETNPHTQLSPMEAQAILLYNGLHPNPEIREVEWTTKDGEKMTGPIPQGDLARMWSGKKGGITRSTVANAIRNGLGKLRDYLQDLNIKDPEKALQKFNLEPDKFEESLIISNFLETMMEVFELELEMLQETQKIPAVVSINGVNTGVSIVVESDTLKVLDAVNEFKESVLSSVPGDLITDAKIQTKIRTGSKYFSEMAAQIMSIKMQPVLGIIGAKALDEEEDQEQEE